MSLVDLLQFLAAGRKSGTLKFDRGKITKQVYFKNGLIVGSKSNDPREYLGQVLLHYGKVDDAQLKTAREAQRSSGAKLGEVLVQQGFLTESEVLEILKTRTLDAIYDLFMWNEGEFEFYDDEPPPEDLLLIEVGQKLSKSGGAEQDATKIDDAVREALDSSTDQIGRAHV